MHIQCRAESAVSGTQQEALGTPHEMVSDAHMTAMCCLTTSNYIRTLLGT
jgi:hypothetical protein